MSESARWLAKENARRAKAEAEGQASVVAQLEEVPVIGAAFTSEGVGEAKSPMKESDEAPTPTEAPELTLSEALAQGGQRS